MRVHRVCEQVCKNLGTEAVRAEGSSWSPTDCADRITRPERVSHPEDPAKP